MKSHILLIEPDAVLASNYSQVLGQAGFSVSWCQSAQSAIASADKTKPDLVLLELQLPRHNGAEFLYEFRSYPEWQKIPVIILSLLPVADPALSPTLKEQLNITAHYYKTQTKLQTLVDSVNQLLAPAS